MKYREKQIIILFFLIFFFVSLTLCTDSYAQMVAGYPKKFHLSGLIEIQYKNYHNESSSDRRSSVNEYSNLKNRLRLNLDGYVYHPRLIVFRSSFDISFFKSLTGVDIKGRDLGYSLYLTALPYRPVSLDLFASRDNYSFEAKTQALPDRTITRYGARLNINLAKFSPLRLIRLLYDHWDFDTEGISENSKSTAYTLNVHGLLNRIKTSYVFTATSNKFSSPIIDIDSKLLNLSTDTVLTKKGLRLVTSFFYTKNHDSTDNYDKEMNFGASLNFPPGERYYHNYGYIYDKTDIFYAGDELAGTTDKSIKSSYYMLSGGWGYRFTEKLMSSLSLDYGKRKVNSDSGSIKALGATLSYRRSFAGFNYESSYRFILRKDELRENSKEHWVTINLKRNLRIGTAYLLYTLIKTDSESDVFASEDEFFDEEKIKIGERKTSVLSHTVSLGIRGRGFGSLFRRAIWTLEATYYNNKAEIERPVQTEDFLETTEHITRKNHQYSFYGQVIIPIRNSLNINARATYLFGKTETINKNTIDLLGETGPVSRNSLIIHTSLNYLIYRNLIFTALWRGKWDEIENRPGTRRTFDYEAVLDYQRGKFSCTLEFYLTDTKENEINFISRRVFFTVKRYL